MNITFCYIIFFILTQIFQFSVKPMQPQVYITNLNGKSQLLKRTSFKAGTSVTTDITGIARINLENSEIILTGSSNLDIMKDELNLIGSMWMITGEFPIKYKIFSLGLNVIPDKNSAFGIIYLGDTIKICVISGTVSITTPKETEIITADHEYSYSISDEFGYVDKISETSKIQWQRFGFTPEIKNEAGIKPHFLPDFKR